MSRKDEFYAALIAVSLLALFGMFVVYSDISARPEFLQACSDDGRLTAEQCMIAWELMK